jgi:glutathione S-transferase
LQDKRFSFAEWPGIKPSMPFHQVPVLQLEDGRTLTQMAAIGENNIVC